MLWSSHGFFFSIRCHACPVLPVLLSVSCFGKEEGIIPPLCRHCEARKSSQRETCPCFASLSSIVIARLGKAEYLKSLRQISSSPSSSLQTDGVGGRLAFGIPLSPIVIARLGKAEAIQSDNKASLLTGFSGQAPK